MGLSYQWQSQLTALPATCPTDPEVRLFLESLVIRAAGG